MIDIINQENINKLKALSNAGINVNDFLNKIMKFNNESINSFVDVVKKIEEVEAVSDITFKSIKNTLGYNYDKNNESIIWSKKIFGHRDISDFCYMTRLSFRHMYNKYYIETFNKNFEIRIKDVDSSLDDVSNKLIEEFYEMQQNSTSILMSYKILIKNFLLDLNNYPELFSIKINKIENTFNSESEEMMFLLKEQEQVLEFIFKITHLFYLEISKEHNKADFSEKQKSILSDIERDLEELEININKVNKNSSVDCRNILDNQIEKLNSLLRCCSKFIKYKEEIDYLNARKLYEKEINVL